ncbi:sulfite exporter TauE/SafE family protein [Nocardia terpenica]|uniref:sulfite exporter TauE/SafE family protein n=1 Tax=Nocardia terpenica TaxID=455432 RepID=UPI001895D4A6|nr:sulfite exporter TauE/SafE family protein [Nocardia terpenica]MBF6061983.1 sulfite exporter TauE/SafE family protein [Nocardia terpenica]MBF6106217.1 sulfite exporter TauE/SafE family protein [Nocardia terpenica]MBF6110403.1 sulfite exporter TauE/SafE family protein [Nocardia terpenica]MBF6120760.1 sulfite exporter TauE/SafE family protein [Nocardia terpenica]MBF6151739.1 sulfite exporter TauE/SafE family protein [Nocardia terpenica]
MIIAAVVLGAGIGVCLGALGGGGSIITTPALVYLLDQPFSTAITQSLVIVGISAGVTAIAYARTGHVKWVVGVALGAMGGIAAWGGAALGRLVPADTTLAGFSVLMVLVAFSMLKRSTPARRASPRSRIAVAARSGSATYDAESGTVAEESGTVAGDSPGRPAARAALEVVLAGLLIGLLTGFFGVGGGFVIVPVLVIVMGYPMPVAVGTSLLVIALNSATALLARAGHEAIDWSLVLPVTIAAILGSVAGKHLALRISEQTLTRGFATMLLVIAVCVGVRSSGLLL